MKKISIIGAGTMGVDLVLLFASNGFNVTARDISDVVITNAEARLNKNVTRLVERGKMSEDEKTALLSRATFTTDLKQVADSDLVIEAIIEDVDVKKGLFMELDALCAEHTILATNTSSISITELSSAVHRRDKFIGMHFFNPIPVMKLVEVIRALQTSDETFSTICELAAKIGKEPVQVNDGPGFIVNKILIPMINEAICVLMDGIASAEDIDKAMKFGANHPMGPLALADLIGNDVVLHIMKILHEETGDPRYRPAFLLRQMVSGGLLGRKTGRGFFVYED